MGKKYITKTSKKILATAILVGGVGLLAPIAVKADAVYPEFGRHEENGKNIGMKMVSDRELMKRDLQPS